MTRASVYEDVTSRIISSLEEGVAPWRIPWTGGYPVNIRSGRTYRGVNVLLLALAGFGDPRWGTYRAIAEAGGQVRKGERSTAIILWKPIKPKTETDDEQQQRDGAYLLLRSYAVFNALQADGLPELPPAVEHDPIERAEEIVRTYVPHGPLIQFGADSAYYSQTNDLVGCPALGQFERVEAYYSTLYHELTHSTGHKSRLDRLESGGFGSGPYAKEELVAEIGSSFLCGFAQIDNLDQSAAYLKGWLKSLAGDPKFVVQAAAAAQKAVDLILGETFEGSDSQESENPVAVAA